MFGLEMLRILVIFEMVFFNWNIFFLWSLEIIFILIFWFKWIFWFKRLGLIILLIIFWILFDRIFIGFFCWGREIFWGDLGSILLIFKLIKFRIFKVIFWYVEILRLIYNIFLSLFWVFLMKKVDLWIFLLRGLIIVL